MSSRPAAGAGALFVISAPSGTGKTTVVERLVEAVDGLARSRSYTSRPARAGETDGVDYNFISRERFDAMVASSDFLEWANIFGHRYGTARADTEALRQAGRDVVLTIDVQGARQVRTLVPDAIGIFVLPPSYTVLAARLRGRNQDSAEAIDRRLATARSEVDAVREYDYVVVNDDVERVVAEVAAIVQAERARRARRAEVVASVIGTFREANDKNDKQERAEHE